MSQKLSPTLLISLLIAGVAALGLIIYLAFRSAAPTSDGGSAAVAPQVERGKSVSRARNQGGAP